MPYRLAPQIEPSPPSGIGEAEALLRASLAKKRRFMIGLIVVGLLVVTSPFSYMAFGVVRDTLETRALHKARRVDASQEAELPALFARADAAIAERKALWATLTTRDALVKQEPGRLRCANAPSAPTTSDAESYVKGSVGLRAFGSADYTVVQQGEAVPTDDGGTASAAAIVTRMKLDATRKDVQKRDVPDLQSIAAGTYFANRRRVIVLVDYERPPMPETSGGELTYVGGSRVGRAYLVSAKGVECVGDLDVDSSHSVDIRYVTRSSFDTSSRTEALRGALARDLDVQTRRALSRDLRAVRPDRAPG